MKGKLVKSATAYTATSIMVLLIILITSVVPVHAQQTTPPAPIIVTQEYGKSVTGRFTPNSAYYGPAGEQMVIANSYYPWFNNKVKTDGWADANFRQPGFAVITCKSRVTNTSGQDSGWQSDSSGWGGTDCGPTPIAEISSAAKPSTYTSRTQAFWDWLDSSDGFGEANQSHYES